MAWCQEQLDMRNHGQEWELESRTAYRVKDGNCYVVEVFPGVFETTGFSKAGYFTREKAIEIAKHQPGDFEIDRLTTNVCFYVGENAPYSRVATLPNSFKHDRK